MALEVDFLDSFGHYNSAALGRTKWAAMNNYGGPPAPFGQDGYTDVGTQNFVARNPFEFSAYCHPTNPGFEFDAYMVYDTFGQQLRVRFAPDGTILIRRPAAAGGGIIVQSAAASFTFNVWHHIRVRMVISDTVGEVYVWIDGALVVNGAGPYDTQHSTTATITQFTTGVLTSHVATGDNFVGQPRVGVTFASGPGDHADFTPSAGANWQCIDENPASTADSNAAAVAGMKDTFVYANAIPLNAVILACAVTCYVKKTEATICEMAGVVHPPGGADVDGVTKQVPASDSFLQWIWELNPFTGLAWTPAEANNSGAGGFRAGYKAITVTP